MLHLPLDLSGMCVREGRRFGVRSFGFKEAGLTGVKEVWFRFKGASTSPSTRSSNNSTGTGGGVARELIVYILWRLLWEKQLPHLAKIGFIHEGTMPLLSLVSLLGMLRSFTPLVVSTRWRVQSVFEHGRLLCVEMGGARRRVEVLAGYSFREAEEYVDGCGEIAAVCVFCFSSLNFAVLTGDGGGVVKRKLSVLLSNGIHGMVFFC